MQNNSKGFIQLPMLIAIIVGVVTIGGGGYFGVKQYQNYQVKKISKEQELKKAQDLLISQQKITAQEEQDKQKSEMEKLKNEVEDLKNKPPQTIIKEVPQEKSKTIDLPSIISEWRLKTAYIVCSWTVNGRNAYQTVSGSGFLAVLSSGIQIITNKHVVVDPQYGVATVCLFKFSDDDSYYWVSNSSFIMIDTAGYDVGYITNLEPPHGDVSKTISERSGKSFNLCKQAPNIGDPVVIIGYPDYGTGSLIQNVSSIEVTATEGIISGFTDGYYTTSAKIEHGNSGGLAIDETRNCYLGIPSAAVVGGIESLGYILPASVFLQ